MCFLGIGEYTLVYTVYEQSLIIILYSSRDSELYINKLSVEPDEKLVWLEMSPKKTEEPDMYPGFHGAALRVMSLASLGGKVTGVMGEKHPALQGGDTDHMIIRYVLRFSPSLCIINHLFQLSWQNQKASNHRIQLC